MFEIYGRNNCQSCENAKNFLLERAEPFIYHNIEEDKEALEEFKVRFPDIKTVPQITYHGIFVGGHENLRKLWYSGPREFWFV